MAQRRFFGMVSTSSSERYTVEALKSFAAVSSLRPGDRFFLIHNDGRPKLELPTFPGLETLINSVPRGFAANMNSVLKLARDAKADLFFLNNDVIFPKGWLDPLSAGVPAVLSPLSNAEVEYSSGSLACKFTMDLDEYLGRENDLEVIATKHQRRARGLLNVFSFPFFCVKLPHAVYAEVGELDENFGPGGGEDKDYCIRVHLAGLSVQHALGSYVLHFQGKSTWRGPEVAEETAKRSEAYISAFRVKWGEPLTRLFIMQDEKVVAERRLERAKQEGRLADIVKELRKG